MNNQTDYLMVILFLIVVCIWAYKGLIYLGHLLAELKINYRFLKEFKKKDIFDLTFSEEIESLPQITSMKCKFLTHFYLRKILAAKFLDYLNKNSDNSKLISMMNFALKKVFFFDNSEGFRKKVLKMVLVKKDKLIYEVDNFQKVDKTYVLEIFFDWFNKKPVDIPFLNKFNEILFRKAASFAFYYKKETLLKTLDNLQILSVQKFLI